MEKMTNVKALEIAIALVTDAEAVEKLTKMKAQYEKKNTAIRKPTANQKENAEIKTAILMGLESNVLYSIADIMKAVPACEGLSSQRVSAIVTQMVKADKTIVRIEDKRKAYFRLAD